MSNTLAYFFTIVNEVFSIVNANIPIVKLTPWLAIHACHRLMKEGCRRQKTSDSLFQETLVQTKLFNSDDYKSWCTNTAKSNTWKHKKLMNVTKDEVEELFDKS